MHTEVLPSEMSTKGVKLSSSGDSGNLVKPDHPKTIVTIFFEPQKPLASGKSAFDVFKLPDAMLSRRKGGKKIVPFFLPLKW